MADEARGAVARQVFEKAIDQYVQALDEHAGARQQFEGALRQLRDAREHRTDAQFDALLEARTRLALAQRNLEIQQARYDGAEAELRRATGRPALPGAAGARPAGVN